MKKPAAKAKPAPKPAVKKTSVAKQAVPAAKKVSAAKPVKPAAPPKAPCREQGQGGELQSASPSTKAAGAHAAATCTIDSHEKSGCRLHHCGDHGHDHSDRSTSTPPPRLLPHAADACRGCRS